MPIIDDWSGVFSPINGPATHAAAVIPNDNNDLTHLCSALHIGISGDVRVVTHGNETVTFVDVIGILPIRVRRVFATGTTALGIVAVW